LLRVINVSINRYLIRKKTSNKHDSILKEAFDKVDKDKSGFIEKHELVLLLNDIAKDLGAS